MKAGLLRALEKCVDKYETLAYTKEQKEVLIRARQGLKSLRSTADPQRRRILRKHKDEG